MVCLQHCVSCLKSNWTCRSALEWLLWPGMSKNLKKIVAAAAAACKLQELLSKLIKLRETSSVCLCWSSSVAWGDAKLKVAFEMVSSSKPSYFSERSSSLQHLLNSSSWSSHPSPRVSIRLPCHCPRRSGQPQICNAGHFFLWPLCKLLCSHWFWCPIP